MGCLAQSGLLLLAVAACLNARPIAGGTVTVIHVPNAHGQIEWTAEGLSSGWEVAVTFDAERCDIYCSIRRKPDALGRVPAIDLLLPPVVTLHMDGGDAIVVDPSGRSLPGALDAPSASVDQAALPGKISLRSTGGAPIAIPCAHRAFRPPSPAHAAFTHILPLRI